MSDFIKFKKAVQKQIEKLSEIALWVVDVDKDELWNLYLDSFPEGTNEIFREKREYDCSCCRQFIKNIGSLVSIDKDYNLISIWDIKGLEYPFDIVAYKLSNYVKSHKISNIYMNDSVHVGVNRNIENLGNGKTKSWDHFYYKLDPKYKMKGADIASFLGEKREDRNVLRRSLEEISLESAEIVLELINQNSIYRGKEFKEIVRKFLQVKKVYESLDPKTRENFTWTGASVLNGAGRFRNTVIGTLLVDISEGKSLESAVASFESKVAPTNYKRSSALITKSMIKKAQEDINALGFEDSLERRYAKQSDVTINNVLFASHDVKKSMNVFDDLMKETKQNKPNMVKVETINIRDFVDSILPKVDSIEMFVENKHIPNLMSLVAPVYPDSKVMFKWDNNFSWSYNGEVTDSIKERVKKQGGAVDGALRVSLSWYNSDDLDLHLKEPNGTEIYYGSRKSYHTGGTLDVDMNVGTHGPQTSSTEPVENITYGNINKIENGRYTVIVDNFTSRNTDNVGYELEIEYLGKVHTFSYKSRVRSHMKALEFEIKGDSIKILNSKLKASSGSQEIWNIKTETFVPVKMIMKSPNHWDDNSVGNEHTFFILQDCLNPGETRGFYNEFLKNELNEHRKVFEVLASKMKVEPSDEQLSGLGFSSTMEKEVILKVSGSFNRVLKVQF